jgi:hypothetical protein
MVLCRTEMSISESSVIRQIWGVRRRNVTCQTCHGNYPFYARSTRSSVSLCMCLSLFPPVWRASYGDVYFRTHIADLGHAVTHTTHTTNTHLHSDFYLARSGQVAPKQCPHTHTHTHTLSRKPASLSLRTHLPQTHPHT